MAAGRIGIIAESKKIKRKEYIFVKFYKKFISIILILGSCSLVRAECPLDHFIIGCNQDGITNTDDDKKLFVNCRQKYRDSGDTEYANWFYPLRKSIFSSYPYRIGEPGFDAFQSSNSNAKYTYDPNRALAGNPDVDYRILVECVSMSPGLRMVHKEYPQFTISNVGDTFSHSYIYNLRGDGHMHMSYQAIDGENMHWITLRLYDELADGDQYEPSELFTIVFNTNPLSGDLVVDGQVDIKDLIELSSHWLLQQGSIDNDYYERADSNRDGWVNFVDFSLLASNWLQSPNCTEEK